MAAHPAVAGPGYEVLRRQAPASASWWCRPRPDCPGRHGTAGTGAPSPPTIGSGRRTTQPAGPVRVSPCMMPTQAASATPGAQGTPGVQGCRTERLGLGTGEPLPGGLGSGQPGGSARLAARRCYTTCRCSLSALLWQRGLRMALNSGAGSWTTFGFMKWSTPLNAADGLRFVASCYSAAMRPASSTTCGIS